MSQTASNAIQPILNLQENCSNFYKKINEKYHEQMNCKQGCARCCFVNLSIFQAEAYRIIVWVLNLDAGKKKELLELLQKPMQSEEKNFQNKLASPCVFLRDNSCTIYEARPTICRTQGVPLQFKQVDKENNINITVDHCPLNFSDQDNFPNKNEWLDLDRLNTLQSIAENFFLKNQQKQDSQIQLAVDKNQRISLTSLKKEVIKILEKEE
ncbi:YkgJ family cysteine cluster protein [Pigmentibacter sp. JX0631]|uniref:YkgJ family cysteine cluster protein n=1 Tax=Pigmentibacter sp. JX0631 TaxID=2976982 RepID=UPI002468C69C|nr:YkgJ family cysteine cluster protein [Pigmentibacter sp. JX0631]WGL58668.1 YkgJ family cysteine cluster protein [Pigmentibacter sp. JX0631]